MSYKSIIDTASRNSVRFKVAGCIIDALGLIISESVVQNCPELQQAQRGGGSPLDVIVYAPLYCMSTIRYTRSICRNVDGKYHAYIRNAADNILRVSIWTLEEKYREDIVSEYDTPRTGLVRALGHQ